MIIAAMSVCGVLSTVAVAARAQWMAIIFLPMFVILGLWSLDH